MFKQPDMLLKIKIKKLKTSYYSSQNPPDLSVRPANKTLDVVQTALCPEATRGTHKLHIYASV